MENLKWWETAIIYQIYPRSFQDSNSDGIGDLPGITSRLNYIANLGVDAIWISPFFRSPQKDFGYDVSDYCEIHEEYGTLNDFDKMIAKAHDLGLKLMIDIVPGHCSEQHMWFEESRQSKTNPKADWFHWVDPLDDGSAPTNWLSFFGGRAWTWEPRRQQYYLHNFLPSQPNLNHGNLQVREAFCDIARFWFDRGVDGFRMDAVHTINADSAPYRNNLAKPDFELGTLPQQQQPFFRQLHDTAQLNQPAIQHFIEEFRKVADIYDGDRFLMGELHGDDAVLASKTFTAPGRLHATYNFNLLEWAGLDVDGLKQAIFSAIEAFNGSGRLSFAFSNHDVPRSATRQLGPLGLKTDKQEALQLLLLKLEVSLIGSTCIYQGEELALSDVQDIPIDRMQDPWGVEFAPIFLGRDTCRTPMVWRKGDNHWGGFSDAQSTWLPISQNHMVRAGLDEAERPGSVYNNLAGFLAWRKKQPAMQDANDMELIVSSTEEIIFDRISAEQSLRCIFNFQNLTASFSEI
jgi:alpha-glucosidase